MRCVAGRRDELPPPLMEGIGRYRHRVFINHLGWPLQCADGIESDEFDGANAVYVSSRDHQGLVNGVARLLPTTAPYLLEKIFPYLWGGGSLPRSDDVWELSRFAAVDFNTNRSLRHQASAKHAAELFINTMRIAKKCGVRRLVTVSPVGMERLMRANGFRSQREGVPVIHNNDAIVALSIDCEIS